MTTPDIRLKERRKALRLTQAELAARLDVQRTTVTEWETGKLPIGNPSILDLALKGLEAEAVTASPRQPRSR